MSQSNMSPKESSEYFLNEVKADDGKKTTQALNNYLELSSEINMPVLRINDLLQDEKPQEKEISYESETVNYDASPEISISEIKTESNEVYEPEIRKPNERIQEKAMRIADKVEKEVHKFWTSKRIVRNLIKEITTLTAYSFVKYMITISDTGSVLGDVKKYITYEELRHLMFCLLQQAKSSGMVNIAQYRRLKREYEKITIIWKKYPKKSLDRRTSEKMNAKLEEMFEEMTKVF